VSAFFRWTMEEGWASANPVIGTRKPADPKPRDRTLADSELVAIWNACGDDDCGRIVRLLILTGSRRTEVGGICFSELELETGVWTLPAERAKNHRANTITLPPAALRIVRAQADMRFALRDGRDHLFGARSAHGYVAWEHGKTTIDRRLVSKAMKPW